MFNIAIHFDLTFVLSKVPSHTQLVTQLHNHVAIYRSGMADFSELPQILIKDNSLIFMRVYTIQITVS
jgi:hypothetical protein